MWLAVSSMSWQMAEQMFVTYGMVSTWDWRSRSRKGDENKRHIKGIFVGVDDEYLSESLLGAEGTVSVGLEAQVVKPWEQIQPSVTTRLLVPTAQNNLVGLQKF